MVVFFFVFSPKVLFAARQCSWVKVAAGWGQGGVFPALRGGVTPEGWRRERGQLRRPQGSPSAISIHYHPLSSNLSIPIPFFGSIPIEFPRCRWISTVWRGVAPDMGTDLKDAGRIAGALFHASCKGPGQWQPCIFSKPCMLKMWIDGLFIRWWERIVTNKHCRILMYICFFHGNYPLTIY